MGYGAIRQAVFARTRSHSGTGGRSGQDHGFTRRREAAKNDQPFTKAKGQSWL
jgi:hypothetical protein